MGGREGSSLLDPTRGLTPGGACRARERFKKQIAESEARIRELKRKKEQICNNLNDLISKEETNIQEAYLVLRMIEDAWGEDQDKEPDPEDVLWAKQDAIEVSLHETPPGEIRSTEDVQVIKKVVESGDGKHEIVLYGMPYY